MSMSEFFFGPYCKKCGVNRTHDEMCGDCALKERIASETVRPCPVCSEKMLKDTEIEDGLIIDNCPNGHGIFLDVDEIEKIREAAESSGSGSGFAGGFVLGSVIN